jgi:hypothetical protein
VRYFFNYRDASRYFPDGEGTDLADLAAATSEGRLSSRELLGAERAESDPDYSSGPFEITNLGGEVLAIVSFRDSERSS